MCTDVCVCMCVCVCVYVCTCVPAYIVQLLISLRLFFSFSDLVFIVQQIVKVKLVILCYSYCAYSYSLYINQKIHLIKYCSPHSPHELYVVVFYYVHLLVNVLIKTV